MLPLRVEGPFISQKNSTSLHKAIDEGNFDIAKYLLAQDVEINTKDNYGWTPLCLASFKGNGEAVKLLLSHNAKYNVQINPCGPSWLSHLLCLSRPPISLAKEGKSIHYDQQHDDIIELLNAQTGKERHAKDRTPRPRNQRILNSLFRRTSCSK